MAQKKRDFGLILSLGLIIAVASYWFVKEVPMDGVEHYVDLLGDKLMALIPEEQEKQEMAAIYDEFKTKVKEKKISPENVEQVASAIINLSNTGDFLSLSDAEALIQIAISSVPVDSFDIIHVPDIEATPEEWEDLEDRLGSVHRIEKELQNHIIFTPETPMPRYRVDEKLNIIIDRRVKVDLKKEQFLKELEEDERVFWTDSMAENMEKELQSLEIKLEAFSEDLEIKHNIIKMKIMNHPVGEGLVFSIDSLDLISLLNFDSLEGELSKKIEYYEIEKNNGVKIEP
jgi:hypothetical protein